MKRNWANGWEEAEEGKRPGAIMDGCGGMEGGKNDEEGDEFEVVAATLNIGGIGIVVGFGWVDVEDEEMAGNDCKEEEDEGGGRSGILLNVIDV
jgi:hypothetical protein